MAPCDFDKKLSHHGIQCMCVCVCVANDFFHNVTRLPGLYDMGLLQKPISLINGN